MTKSNTASKTPIQPAILPDEDVAASQVTYTVEFVTIRNLINDRKIYEHYPKFQRGFVWIPKMRRALIDSLLRGLPIGDLLAVKAIDETGEEIYHIIDGHQRLSTIYLYMNGEFATSTVAQSKRDEGSELSPVEPGRRAPELSQQTRNALLGRNIAIKVLHTSDERLIALHFRRVQHQMPLTQGERLAAYTSKAIDIATKLKQHPIWDNLYLGKKLRNETLQACLSLIAMELQQGCANIASSALYDLAAGAKDERIPSNFYETIVNHLDTIACAFDGIVISHRTEIIPMYQTILFLENRGHIFKTSSDKGRLTPWFGEVLHEASIKRRDGLNGFNYPLARMIELTKQYEFWEIHLPRIIEICEEAKDAA